jgi:hypothetical protein
MRRYNGDGEWNGKMVLRYYGITVLRYDGITVTICMICGKQKNDFLSCTNV